MGYEYKIKMQSMDRDQVDSCLRAISCFAEFDAERSLYIYREGTNIGEIPNVVIKLESDEFYICDFGSSQSLMSEITRILSENFGEVHFEDYEP